MAAATVVDMIRTQAEDMGQLPAIRFKEQTASVTWTWAELWENIQRVAAGLHRAGIRPADRVLVLVPEVRLSVASVLGVLASGAAATVVGLPYRLSNVAGFIAELRGTLRRLDARALVAGQSIALLAGRDVTDVSLLVAEELVKSPAGSTVPWIDPSQTAFIQLTSGSTGRSRGVVIPHDRLMLHLQSISEGLPSAADSVGVSWLPLHHDMGLIGGLLYPLYNRFVIHLLSPLDFQSRPLDWLATLSEARATHCVGPPSAFAIAIALARRAVEAKLDLSSIVCAMIGAEPISARLLRRFSDAYAPCGFRPEAFFPVYGLAEATVAVTFPSMMQPTRVDRIDREALETQGVAMPQAEEAGSIEFVGVGRPIAHTEICITGESGAPAGERVVGEILVRSRTLMAGYYGEPEATAEAIVDGWLRTGDLGYLAGGDLFITGRKKDIIIKGGHNLVPSVIEEAVSAVPGVRAGCVVAVGVYSAERETELAYVVAETRTDPAEHEALAQRVRDALKAHGIAVDHIRLVPAGTLPKTTSGKLRRAAVAQWISTRGMERREELVS